MRILVCDAAYPLDLVRATLPSAEVGDVATAGEGVAALLVGPDAPVAGADIDRMPDLRVISTASTGTDHIDVAAAERRGIAVRNAVGYCTEEVADHALALIVSMRRGIPVYDRSVQAGAWDWLAFGLPPRLAGTRLGIVGWGRIGRRLAEKAQGLEMDVRWFDPLVDGGEPELDALLRWADAVSLHAPLTPDTEGLIDEARLAMLKPGAILVNTARGQLIDREALKRATHIRAALDTVWEKPPAHDLRGLDHVVLTPYVAWLSPETELVPYRLAAEAVADELSLVS
ncbi:MAG: D-3-phosphoglycerate dehydrogenase / 2-oxoglutarate reductase [Gaiellales bacterium]|nr:D-3-phosphoglycerate dehydrogenase / 2-oxoglutarate reductase [Gaiellales bacterium]